MAEGWSAHCKAELGSCGFDRDGNLTISFTVAAENKYDVLPISDIRGRAFELDISTASKRVYAGKEGVAEAKQRVEARKAARAAEGPDAGVLP